METCTNHSSGPGSRKENNFDIMRLMAAWMVLYSHSFTLYGYGHEPFAQIGFNSAAGLGLNVFFVISGYLITASFIQQPAMIVFTIKRLLRLLPGLAVVLFLTAFIIGPLVTSLPLSEYFSRAETYKYLRSVFILPMRYELPGVFENLPYPDTVNGSLWSLKTELRCYALIALFGIVGLLKPRFIALFAIGSLITYGVLYPNPEMFPKRILDIKYSNLVSNSRWFFTFFAGSAFYLFKDRICFHPILFYISCFICIGAWYMPAEGQLIHILMLPYIILYIGLHMRPIGHLLRRQDISYGIYIYAFPLQQLYMYYIADAWGFAPFVGIVTIASIICGWFSWRYIEKPCLRLKNRLYNFNFSLLYKFRFNR